MHELLLISKMPALEDFEQRATKTSWSDVHAKLSYEESTLSESDQWGDNQLGMRLP